MLLMAVPRILLNAETGLERSTRYYWLCPVSFSMRKLDWYAAHATTGYAPRFTGYWTSQEKGERAQMLAIITVEAESL